MLISIGLSLGAGATFPLPQWSKTAEIEVTYLDLQPTEDMFYLFIFIFLFIFILGSANVIGDFTGSCSLLQSNSRALSILNICFGLKKLFFLVSMAKKLIPCKRNDFAPLAFQLKKWRGRQV